MNYLEQLKVNNNIILSPQQEQAVMKIDGATLVIGVPGSGKTTVIISRLGNMIFNHQIPPEHILNITFSDALARDNKLRFIKLFGPDTDKHVDFKTIHNFCLEVLKEFCQLNDIPFPELLEDNFSVIKSIYVNQTQSNVEDKIIWEIVQLISSSTNRLLSPDRIDKIEFRDCDFKEIYNQYFEYKERLGTIDNDDILNIVLDIFLDEPEFLDKYQEQYKHINLDEAQEITFLQYEIIRLLAQKYGNIFMVGDDDQRIYGYRVAYSNALKLFDRTYNNAIVLKMERNYRSTKNIVSVANAFIKQNKERFDKDMFCENEEGLPINHVNLNDLSEQYNFIVQQIINLDTNNDLAILYRYDDSAVPLVDALYHEGIQFSIREYTSAFFTHFVTNDILTYIKLANDESDIVAFEKIYHRLELDITKTMLDFVKQNLRGNIFSTLLKFPKLGKEMSSRISRRQTDFDELRRIEPSKAISFIESKMGYSEILKDLDSMGDSFEILNQKINILKSVASKCRNQSDFLNKIDQLRKIMENSVGNESKVILSTIHSSKGLEFDNVILIDAIDDLFPSSKSIKQIVLHNRSFLFEEEIRLFYVGITRARREFITISSVKSNKKLIEMSRFIDYLKQKTFEQTDVERIQDSIVHKPYIINSWDKRYVEKEMRRYKVGTKIAHAKFGEGIIVGISGETLDVNFSNDRTTKINLKTCVKNELIEVL